MLVYAKTPRGILYVNGTPIYGREDGHDPVDISFEMYEACKEAVEDATYREGYLREKFGWSLGPIAFTYGELRFLPENTLRKIARGLGVDEASRTTIKQLVEDIKRVLRDVVATR
jgi:hypothetical protein